MDNINISFDLNFDANEIARQAIEDTIKSAITPFNDEISKSNGALSIRLVSEEQESKDITNYHFQIHHENISDELANRIEKAIHQAFS